MEAATNTDNDELIRTLGIAKREVQTLRSAARKVYVQRCATSRVLFRLPNHKQAEAWIDAQVEAAAAATAQDSK